MPFGEVFLTVISFAVRKKSKNPTTSVLSNKKRARTIWLARILCLTALFVSLAANGFTEEYTKMPDIIGDRFVEAVVVIKEAGLTLIYDEQLDGETKINVQYPKADMIVRRGARVFAEPSHSTNILYTRIMEPIEDEAVVRRLGLPSEISVEYYGWHINGRIFGTVQFTLLDGKVYIANVHNGRIDRVYDEDGWFDGRLRNGEQNGLICCRDWSGNVTLLAFFREGAQLFYIYRK